MDIIALTHPTLPDRESLQDFFDALKEHAQTAERETVRLRKTPDNHDAISALFRAIHNIKGDAMLCRFDTGAVLAHPIESLLSRTRGGDIPFSEMLAEVILLAIDRLELAAEAALAGKPLTHLKLVELARGLEAMASLQGSEIDSYCARVIEATTGFRPATAQPSFDHSPARISPERDAGRDLAFFRTLALQLDARSPMLRDRSVRISRLALEANELAGRPISPDQLEAAALMHDIGMMLLPDALWLKLGQLTDEERRSIRAHPGYGAGLLERMNGWQEAARIVLEHHEMPDGKGYPNGLTASQICPGAKLLAIVDAFESVILKQAHRGRSRSFLRAAAEINANPNQFAPEWIDPFNRVIRGLLERS